MSERKSKDGHGTTPGSFQTATKGRKGVSGNGAGRARGLAPALVGLAFLVLGVGLLGNSFLGGGEGKAAVGGAQGNAAANVPGPVQDSTRGSVRGSLGPKDKTLELTVPRMARVRHDTVPYASDEGALRRNAAIHLKGTGFPWQRGANVYLAGHRLGYPGTESWLTFWDLNEVRDGDRVFLTDANGTRYAYRVFKKFVVDPDESWVTEPVPGKNVLTLQTCTLPDYKQRLIVRADLVGKRKAPAGGSPR